MSRVDRSEVARRPALRRRACAAAVVAAFGLWSALGTAAAVAAPAPGGVDAGADAGATSTACPSLGLLGADARSGAVDQWSGGDRAAPTRLSAATRVADDVRAARLIAADAGAGVLFAVGTDGRLRYYTHDATSGRYQGGAVVGLKWDGVTQLVAGGQGIFYAVGGT